MASRISKHRTKPSKLELRGVKVPSGLKKNIPTIALPKGSSVYRGMGYAREYSREPIEKGPPKVVSTLAKIRRETAAQSHFTAATKLQRGTISPREMRLKAMPTQSTIVKAPRQLVEQHQKALIAEPIDPSVQPSAAFNPKKRRIEHVEAERSPESLQQEAREKRLRSLTNPSGVRNSLSSTISPLAKTTASPDPHVKTDVSASSAIGRTERLRAQIYRSLPCYYEAHVARHICVQKSHPFQVPTFATRHIKSADPTTDGGSIVACTIRS